MTKISDRLLELGILSGDKICEIFDNLYGDILSSDLEKPSKFISQMWARYTSEKQSLNGAVFEALVATALFRQGIAPIFVQATLAFVPNVNFDFLVYSREIGPLILSCKTSLRERYKQADLEGMMVRQVYRRSKSFLISLDQNEVKNTDKKIARGEILGLDKIIDARSPDLDSLFDELKTYNLYAPSPVQVVAAKRTICHAEN